MALLSSLYYGVLLGISIVLFHIMWSLLIYRYNKDRLGQMALTRYQSLQTEKAPEDHHYAYNNVWTDKKSVVCDIELRDSSQKVVKSERVEYQLARECGIMDIECLNIS